MAILFSVAWNVQTIRKSRRMTALSVLEAVPMPAPDPRGTGIVSRKRQGIGDGEETGIGAFGDPGKLVQGTDGPFLKKCGDPDAVWEKDLV